MCRPDRGVSYKHINRLFTDTADWHLIETHWQDLMQVALSIQAGKISSPMLLRKLGSYSRRNKLYHAAQALGMNYGQMMRLIILPQAFRKMTPLLLQQSIILFQDTSLVYTVGLMDFLNAARSRGDIIGQPHEFLIFAGLVYFTISFAASRLVKLLQKRLAV